MTRRTTLLTAALLGAALTDLPFTALPIRRHEDPPEPSIDPAPEPTQIGSPTGRIQRRRVDQLADERLSQLRKAEEKRFRKAVKRVRLYQKQLCIIAAAIRDDSGRVWQLPIPARHHHIIHLMAEEGLPTPIRGEQGFVTSYGSFVDRKTAAVIATAAKQLKHSTLVCFGTLYTEDVW